MVWSTSAMKYTVDGDSTIVKFPKTLIDDTIKINRWDSTGYTTVKTCPEKGIAVNVTWYECNHSYATPWTYTVEIVNPSNRGISTIYLASANVKEIINLLNFNNLSIIYLSSNQLTDFTSNLSNISQLLLDQNELRTIPSVIRKARWTHQIILDNDISIWNQNNWKLVDLSNNQIDFVWITKINNVDTLDCESHYNNCYFKDTSKYKFERFGFTDNEANLVDGKIDYDYRIKKGGTTIIEKLHWIQKLNGLIANIEENTPLLPGEYTFKVCFNLTNICDSIDFKVNYDEEITIITPVSQPKYGSLNIQWKRWRTWIYPEEIFSWYEYVISKNWWSSITTWWFIGTEDLTNSYSCPYYNCKENLDIGNIIETERSDNPNGKYTLTVYLIDNEWNRAKKRDYWLDNTGYIFTSTTFEIDINNDIDIISPSWEINATRVNNTNPTFEWSGSSSLFDHYIYYITSGNSCSNTKIITDQTENNIHPEFNNINLWKWQYTLCVDMYDAQGHQLNSNTAYSTFIINIPAEIRITKPTTFSDAITYFEWNKFLPSTDNFTRYEYSVTSTNWYSHTDSTTNENETWFQLPNLLNGTYTFNVKMFYNETQYTGASKSFTRNINNANVSISSPRSWDTISDTNTTKTEVSFEWDWGGTLFNKYHYTLKDSSNHELTGWDVTINDINHRQFSYNLWNWTYTFEVKMYNSSDVEIASDSSTFTVNIPTTLNIISPTSGNHSSATTTFSWEWFTPYTFTNYEYTVTWPNWFSVWHTTTGDTSFSLQNLRDGSYTFTITMNYKEWSTPKTITRTREFTINASEWVYLTITSPNKSTYTWNYIKTVPIDFTWNWWGSPLISRYTYTIKDRDDSHLRASGSVNKNDAWSYFIPGTSLALPSGTYRFEVTMLDSENRPVIEPKSYNFEVVIPSYLEILTPPEWQLNIKDVSFSRSWFAEFEHHYKYEVNRVDNQGNIISTIKTGNNIPLTTKSFSLQNLHNGKYTFSIELMDNSDHPIIKKERTFRIPDDLDLILDISDWNSSVTTLKSKKWIFSWGWRSEDFAGYSYSIQGTTFKNETYLYTWRSEWATTGSITLNDLSTGRYRFSVNMLNANGWIITWKHIDFNVVIPASLKIISPTSWSTITSSSATFKWDWYSDVITRYEYSLTSSGWYSNNWFTTATSFNRNDLTNWNYTLVVRLASGTNFVAEDTVHFTVNIPKKSSGGWWGGSSSKSHTTNDLSVSITNDEPVTNERVEVVVDISDKYTWKVDFTKMQYYSFDEEKRIDIPVTSKNYVSDYSDDAKLGYVKFDSSDDGEKNLSEFLMFSQPGNYRIHVEDKDWYNDYVQFYVWKWNNKTQVTTTKEPEQDEDEYYIARSCKKYKIEYLDNLWVYSSPNLKKEEYFINKDYFKRYIDSKNKQINGCPTNVWWISTTYKDTSNSSDRYAAPNGKVYFINGQNWSYSSTQLDKELNGAKKFSTINELKYFIRDRNPFINMSAPVK